MDPRDRPQSQHLLQGLMCITARVISDAMLLCTGGRDEIHVVLNDGKRNSVWCVQQGQVQTWGACRTNINMQLA
jgi:hypothetical protein